jgi:hypothetical protein
LSADTGEAPAGTPPSPDTAVGATRSGRADSAAPAGSRRERILASQALARRESTLLPDDDRPAEDSPRPEQYDSYQRGAVHSCRPARSWTEPVGERRIALDSLTFLPSEGAIAGDRR